MVWRLVSPPYRSVVISLEGGKLLGALRGTEGRTKSYVMIREMNESNWSIMVPHLPSWLVYGENENKGSNEGNSTCLTDEYKYLHQKSLKQRGFPNGLPRLHFLTFRRGTDGVSGR